MSKGLIICRNDFKTDCLSLVCVMMFCYLQKTEIKNAEELQLYTYEFNDLVISDYETLQHTIAMFRESNIIEKFKVPLEVSGISLNSSIIKMGIK